jgi:hypothetical protein
VDYHHRFGLSPTPEHAHILQLGGVGDLFPVSAVATRGRPGVAHHARMDWFEAFRSELVLTSAELARFGATSHRLTTAVRDGELIRPRRDRYVLPGTDQEVVAAVRAGGRLACASVLVRYGVFVFDSRALHLHFERRANRDHVPGVVSHWRPTFDDSRSTGHSVSLVDALAEHLLCEEWRFALASLDNALHQRLIDWTDVDQIFRHAPGRVQFLRRLLDPRAESGQETVLRMIVRETGLPCELQVTMREVGRVDLVVAGCVVVEADSRLAHDGWEKHIEDRGRDLALARLGYGSLRPAYQHTMRRPDLVRAAIVQLVMQQRRASRRAISRQVLP